MTGHCATGDEYGLAGVPASPCPGAHRRRTDLMPAILIRSQAGGGQSTAPNTPGRAVSLSRIDGAAAVCKQPRPSMASSKSMSHLAAQKKTQGPRPTPTANATYHVRAKTGGNLPRKQGRSPLSFLYRSLKCLPFLLSFGKRNRPSAHGKVAPES